MGLRIFLVEDEMFIALMAEDMLQDMGHEVTTAMRLDAALETARTCDVDCALLDINIDGQLSFPIAEILRGRGIPFAFVTGYVDAILPEEFLDVTILRKPYSDNSLSDTVNKLARPH